MFFVRLALRDRAAFDKNLIGDYKLYNFLRMLAWALFLFFRSNFAYGHYVSGEHMSIPISVVFLGQDSAYSMTELALEWFYGLGFSMDQKTLNSSEFFMSVDNEITPPNHYSFNFVVRRLSDAEIFEDILDKVSRPSPFEPKTKTIHPFVLEALLKSFLDWHHEGKITFFALDLKNKGFSVCEGIHKSEFNLKTKRGRCPTKKFVLDKENHDSWFDAVNAALPTLGNWTSSESVSAIINNCEGFESERLFPATEEQCGKNWVMQNTRIFWIGFSDDGDHDVLGSWNFTSTGKDIKDRVEMIEKLCNQQHIMSNRHCEDLVRTVDKLRKSGKRAQDLPKLRFGSFLKYVSAAIVDAVKNVVVPPVPSFDTPMPDEYEIRVTQILEHPEKWVNTSEFETVLTSYLPPGSMWNFSRKIVNIATLPFVALPVNDLRDNGDHFLLEWDTMREGFQAIPVKHRLKNNTARILSSYVIVFDEEKPIRFDNKSSSLAFDYSSVAITNSTHFDPRPLLRSNLVHMYGVPPFESWHSLSIMSPSSRHMELPLLSRDAAYRNAARIELSKARHKVVNRIREIQEIIDFANDTHSLNVSSQVLNAAIDDLNWQIEHAMDLSADFTFGQFPEAIQALHNARKTCQRELKRFLPEVRDLMCEHAPVNMIEKPPSLLDQMDLWASLTMPVWLGALILVFISTLYVCARSAKRD